MVRLCNLLFQVTCSGPYTEGCKVCVWGGGVRTYPLIRQTVSKSCSFFAKNWVYTPKAGLKIWISWTFAPLWKNTWNWQPPFLKSAYSSAFVWWSKYGVGIKLTMFGDKARHHIGSGAKITQVSFSWLSGFLNNFPYSFRFVTILLRQFMNN